MLKIVMSLTGLLGMPTIMMPFSVMAEMFWKVTSEMKPSCSQQDMSGIGKLCCIHGQCLQFD